MSMMASGNRRRSVLIPNEPRLLENRRPGGGDRGGRGLPRPYGVPTGADTAQLALVWYHGLLMAACRRPCHRLANLACACLGLALAFHTRRLIALAALGLREDPLLLDPTGKPLESPLE